MAVFSKNVPSGFVTFRFFGSVIPGIKDKFSDDAFINISSGQ